MFQRGVGREKAERVSIEGVEDWSKMKESRGKNKKGKLETHFSSAARAYMLFRTISISFVTTSTLTRCSPRKYVKEYSCLGTNVLKIEKWLRFWLILSSLLHEMASPFVDLYPLIVMVTGTSVRLFIWLLVTIQLWSPGWKIVIVENIVLLIWAHRAKTKPKPNSATKYTIYKICARNHRWSLTKGIWHLRTAVRLIHQKYKT